MFDMNSKGVNCQLSKRVSVNVYYEQSRGELTVDVNNNEVNCQSLT